MNICMVAAISVFFALLFLLFVGRYRILRRRCVEEYAEHVKETDDGIIEEWRRSRPNSQRIVVMHRLKQGRCSPTVTFKRIERR
jgi:hypothetical protein